MGTDKLCHRIPFVHITDTSLKVSDLWQHGAWSFATLYIVLPQEIITEIKQVRVPSLTSSHDRIRWTKIHDGRYTTCIPYELLMGHDGGDYHPCWKRIWKSKVPEKIRLFLWLIANGTLPTNSKRRINHMSLSASCPRCAAEVEDLYHVFMTCERSQRLW